MTIIAYDLGTGGNKASLYSQDGKRLGAVFIPYKTEYPQPGFHEQRPCDWWEAVVESTRQLFSSSELNPAEVECLAISGHSLGCVPLDASGNLLCEQTPIWSDSRSGRQADAFFERTDPSQWYKTTGNGFPAPHYTVMKIMWYRNNQPDIFSRIDKIIGTKDYVNYRLTGVIATDYSYASGSGVYDLTAWRYSDELIAAAELAPSLFPEILSSTQILGSLTAEAAEALGLPRSVKVTAGGVDNSCMALGAKNIAPGRAYASLGSSSWIAVSSKEPVLDERTKPYVFTHVIPGMFTSACGVFSTGTSMKWVRDNIFPDLVERATRNDRDPYDLMTEMASQSPAGSRGLLFNPSFGGGSSLEPGPNIRGAFLGLDLGHSRDDVCRSVLEGIALNLRIALDALGCLCDIGPDLVAVGGGAKSPLWRQIFADAFKKNVEKTNIGQEAGALGAAAVAAVGAGLWDDFQRIDSAHQIEAVAKPTSEGAAVYDKVLPVFDRARYTQNELGDMLKATGLV